MRKSIIAFCAAIPIAVGILWYWPSEDSTNAGLAPAFAQEHAHDDHEEDHPHPHPHEDEADNHDHPHSSEAAHEHPHEDDHEHPHEDDHEHPHEDGAGHEHPHEDDEAGHAHPHDDEAGHEHPHEDDAEHAHPHEDEEAGHAHPHEGEEADHAHPHEGDEANHAHPHEDEADHEHAGEDGHGHGHAEDSISHTAWSNHVEWFVELERPAPGKEVQFHAHVTLLDDFQPAHEGTFHVTAEQGGQVVETHADAPARPGIYTPSITFPSGGEWEVTLRYEGAAISDDTHYHVEMEGGEAHAHTHDDEHGHSHGGAEETVGFLKEQQWRVPFATAWAEERPMAEHLAVFATVIAPPAARAVIKAPMTGRFVPAEDGPRLAPGEQVARGTVLGYLEPPVAGPEGVAQLANRSAYSSSLAEAELQLAQNRDRLQKTKSELARTQKLFEQKAKSARELESAELEVELAQAAVQSAVSLVQRLKSAAGDGESDALRLPLRAPIDGVLAKVDHVSGAYVSAQTPMFEVLDGRELWVEAQVPERDIGLLETGRGASISCAAYPAMQFPAETISIGAAVAPESRTLPVTLAVNNADNLLRAGMAVTANLQISDADTVVAVPDSAIIDEQGMPVVYVQIDGESFARRVVRTGRKDGGYVEIISGLEPGERVVTDGAYFVRLASAGSTMSAGHGHPHPH